MQLSRTWDGEDFDCLYAFDPLTGKQLDISVKMAFSPAELQDAVENGQIDEDIRRNALEQVLAIAHQISFERAVAIETQHAASIIINAIERSEGKPTREELKSAIHSAVDHIGEFVRRNSR